MSNSRIPYTAIFAYSEIWNIVHVLNRSCRKHKMYCMLRDGWLSFPSHFFLVFHIMSTAILRRQQLLRILTQNTNTKQAKKSEVWTCFLLNTKATIFCSSPSICLFCACTAPTTAGHQSCLSLRPIDFLTNFSFPKQSQRAASGKGWAHSPPGVCPPVPHPGRLPKSWNLLPCQPLHPVPIRTAKCLVCQSTKIKKHNHHYTLPSEYLGLEATKKFSITNKKNN